MNIPTQNITSSKPALDRLIGFLEQDPSNPRLIADTAAAAFEAGKFDFASRLIEQQANQGYLEPNLINLAGLIALAEHRYEEAAQSFATLLEQAPNDPGLRFNLAWAQAMLRNYAQASELLNDSVIQIIGRAAGLKVQMLHHLAKMDEALAIGLQHLEQYPQDQALLSALTLVALDVGKMDIAERFAASIPNTPEGSSTLGVIALSRNDVDQAQASFDNAIRLNPKSGRAWMGRGLGLLATSNNQEAVKCIDKGALLLEKHLGSWIAAGWAHFVNGDLVSARSRFETALEIDSRFSEAHGGIAVLDVFEGKIYEAERRTERALRLNRDCFSGALAKSLLLNKRGDLQLSQKIREAALNTPLSEDGTTIAQALVRFGFSNKSDLS